jgi:hypothetical protein
MLETGSDDLNLNVTFIMKEKYTFIIRKITEKKVMEGILEYK